MPSTTSRAPQEDGSPQIDAYSHGSTITTITSFEESMTGADMPMTSSKIHGGRRWSSNQVNTRSWARLAAICAMHLKDNRVPCIRRTLPADTECGKQLSALPPDVTGVYKPHAQPPTQLRP
jgi:hypothetical protein